MEHAAESGGHLPIATVPTSHGHGICPHRVNISVCHNGLQTTGAHASILFMQPECLLNRATGLLMRQNKMKAIGCLIIQRLQLRKGGMASKIGVCNEEGSSHESSSRDRN